MILGTAGHVDHGKTTLVAALTGVDCDRLSEERRRGMTIELGFAPWKLPSGRRLSLVDVPGHERLVRTMIVGAGGLDALLLCVSAEAGVMPQTREHLAACRVLGVEHVVVALTFVDRVDNPGASAARVRAGLAGTIAADSPILPVDARVGVGLDALATALDDLAAATPTRRGDGDVVLPIDRVFTIEGFGTVATGSLVRGAVAVGDRLAVVAPGRGTSAEWRVRSLHVHDDSVDRVTAGRRLAVNLAGASRDDVPRGSVLATPGTTRTGRVFDAEIDWLPCASRPLARHRGLVIHIAGARAPADVRADAPIAPGDRGTARVRLTAELPLPPGARFVLRGEPDPRRGAVVGGGRIIDAHPPGRRRAAIRAALAANEPLVAILLAEAGRRGIDPASLHARCADAPVLAAERMFDSAVIDDAVAAMVRRVDARHVEAPHSPGHPRAEFVPDALGHRALEIAVERGALRLDGEWVARSDHVAALPREARVLGRKIMRAIGRAGMAGLRETELFERFPAPPARLRIALDDLVVRERVVRAGDLCFPGHELRALRRAVARTVLTGRALRVGDLKATAGISRRQAIPIFEWLDRCGATQRDGNTRIVGPRTELYAELT